jgi:hypothetical protein
VSSRRHLAKRWYVGHGMVLKCTCGGYETEAGSRSEQDELHRQHRVAMGEQVRPRKVAGDSAAPPQDFHKVRARAFHEAAKYLADGAFWGCLEDRCAAVNALITLAGMELVAQERTGNGVSLAWLASLPSVDVEGLL